MAITISGTSGLTFPDSTVLPSATFSPIYPVSASVASNAMTVTLNPCSLAFRSTTLGSGVTSTASVTSPITMTVSSGSTLGTINATQSQIVILAINNAGTIELAVVNLAGGNNLDESTLITTTAEGGAGAADSASTIYSTTARTSVAFRVVGVITSTQTTAGTWAAAPSTIQGVGGQALTSMQSLGYGQTWQNLTGSRSLSTTYYNTTGKPIVVSVTNNENANAPRIYITVSSIIVAYDYRLAPVTRGWRSFVSAIVPPGAPYSVDSDNGVSVWAELR